MTMSAVLKVEGTHPQFWSLGLVKRARKTQNVIITTFFVTVGAYERLNTRT
jgi:hypothetical protein